MTCCRTGQHARPTTATTARCAFKICRVLPPLDVMQLGNIMLILVLNCICSFEHDVAPVVASLPDLARLSLGYNSITGSLSCAVFPSPSSRLVALDVASNELQGSVPACLLQTGGLRELFLGGNSLTGTLPALPEDSPLVELSLENQVGLPCMTHI